MSAAVWEGPLLAAAMLLLSACAGLGLAAGQSSNGQHLAGVARWCAGSGGYLLLLVLAVRGLQIQAWPLASTYEAILLSAAAAALFCALGANGQASSSGAFLAGLGTTVMVAVALLSIPAGARVPQAAPALLQGVWFPLHVIATALGYGGLFVAGLTGLGRLLSRPGAGKGRGPVGQANQLEHLAWRGLAWGYPWLTAGMLFGAVWGWQTWGLYWSWSVKEVLTLLAWGFFTLALHVRRLKGWRGRPYAAVLLAGLAALLLTLAGAGWIARQMGTSVKYLF